MYLHLGQNVVIRTDEIIGLFDLDTTTVSKVTRDFLTKAEKNAQVVNVTDDLPKTFVLTNNNQKRQQRIYISQISTTTLHKRSKKPFENE